MKTAKFYYHKKQGGKLTGPNCKIVLENIDSLATLIELDFSLEALALMPFVSLLRSLNRVRLTCFSTKLAEDWEDALDAFTNNLTTLNADSIKKVLPSFDKVSVIGQGHILMFHVKYFIQETNMGMGMVATHSHESFHPRFL